MKRHAGISPIDELDATTIAEVLETRDGKAVSVRGPDGIVRPVAYHTTSTPYLHPGDRVLVAPVAGGCVVTDRLRAEGEPPAARVEHHPDGGVSLWAEGTIRLFTQGSAIEIHPDGRILVDGDAVTVDTEGRVRLRGESILLN